MNRLAAPMLALCLSLTVVASAWAAEDQATAIAEIKKLGGEVTVEGVKRLQQALPQCQIEHWHDHP